MTSTLTLLLMALASATLVSGIQFSTRLRVTQDVTLERGSTNFNYLPYLLVGKHPGFPNKRSLLQFANVPYTCTKVLSAHLYLYFVYAHKASYMSSQQVPLFPRKIVAHRVLKSWSESQATSTRRYNGAYWSQKLLRAGADMIAYPTSTAVTINPYRRGFYSLDVTSAVKAWKRGYPNFGLLIRATNEYRLGRDFRFASNADRNYGRHAFIQVRCESSLGFGGISPVRKVLPNGGVAPV